MNQTRSLVIALASALSAGLAHAELKDIAPVAEKAGIKLIATERFARADTSVTGQALKPVAANPDAILIVASGSGAAMPHKGLVERGYAPTATPARRSA